MNHLNCFVVGAMAGALDKACSGMLLKDCFSNSPDEIVFVFDRFTCRCTFYKGEIYFGFEEESVSKSRLFKPQFGELHGKKAVSVTAHRFERSFRIVFEDHLTLVFVCHGRRSNILLFEGETFCDMFRQMHEKDSLFSLSDFSKTPEEPDPSMDHAGLKQSCPWLPEEFFTMETLSYPERIERLEHIGGFRFGETDREPEPVYEGNSVLQDLSRFSSLRLRLLRFSDSREELLNAAEKSVADKEAFIRTNRAALDTLLGKRSDEEYGNIILSNIHLIKAGATSARLNDIYTGDEIEIRLDPELSPVENAEKYFRKAKGVPHSIQLLREKIGKAEKNLALSLEKQTALQSARTWKDLKPFVRMETRKEQEDLPFRKFSISGFDVYVGKHAESNEKLLNYYADKDDIWLHAKDVSGSHVLIKCRKAPKIPDAVLEKAAALAAWFSKNRRQSLVSVSWTLRKYVRKIKGAEKGKVTVSREKTLLVKPGVDVA